jgi:hypothetical protein
MYWIDPDFLPATIGVVKQFIPNPHGDLDGLVLLDGEGSAILIHFPRHLSRQIAAAIRIADMIRVHGVRVRGAPLVAATSIVPTQGDPIVDNGLPDKHERKAKGQQEPGRSEEGIEIQIVGRVGLSLYSAKGELRGALLEDGTVLRMGPKEAAHFTALLHPGATVAACGRGIETPYGTAIEVREIGDALSELRPVKSPKPEKKKHDHDEAEETARPAAQAAPA